MKGLLERVAMQHHTLLKQYLSAGEHTVLRGDGYNELDLVGDYTRDVFKLVTLFHRLEVLKLVVKAAYWFLFMLIGLGVIAFLVNLFFDAARPVVLWYATVAVILEIVAIGVVRSESQRLEQYEETV